jgi:general secretion pathway protein G
VSQTIQVRPHSDRGGRPLSSNSGHLDQSDSHLYRESCSGETPVLASSEPAPNRPAESGLTLVELIIVVTILGILSVAAVPVARFQVKRVKEKELRQDLWDMRRAIDMYYDVARKGGIVTKTDSLNYPPDLQTLVDGVDVQDKKVKFLRRIPIDPMTNSTDWGLRSNQDDADSDSFGGQNVFDVHTKSTGTALDGTKYNTW